MPGLIPFPFGRLVSRVLRELEGGGSVLGLPRRSFFRGVPGRDLSVTVHGRRVSTPAGPAAGPHTQLAQNILCGWLAGGRVFELKTVQIRDRLSIPRPCIDMRTVGFNVEWSQELSLAESLEEYVKASMLIDLLKAEGLAPGCDRTLLDMSVGYDLAGVTSEPVRRFIEGLKDAGPTVRRLAGELPGGRRRWRDLAFTTRVSDTVTLSTFHGCPPSEIEAMAEFLMASMGLDVTLKLNPTLLGAHEARRLLRETLGFTELVLPDEAFAADARWDQVLGMAERLDRRALELGRSFGVKFCNTLVVANPGDFLPASEKTRYLSGAPLHVLAMQLVRRFRRHFGDRIPISFSAGIDRLNFPDAVALGLAPVTACSDLLKPGGYGRLKGYLDELVRRMEAAGAGDVPAFTRAAGGAPARSESDARLRLTERHVPAASQDGRYGRARHAEAPRKMGKALALFDCLSCDKCVSACPNGANFAYAPLERELPIVRLVREEGAFVRRAFGATRLAQARQFATFADSCNECGNCDVFCPEDGGPYRVKPRFFGSLEALKASPLDGFFVEGDAVHGRIGGRELSLRVSGGFAECVAERVRLRFRLDRLEGEVNGEAPGELDLTPFHLMNSLRKAVLDPATPNYVNA
ncbi:MAG: glutamate synthase [Elusimicrobia bacterium]|nr:glutamate synthase [Elusimicrobiota bacterium]